MRQTMMALLCFVRTSTAFGRLLAHGKSIDTDGEPETEFKPYARTCTAGDRGTRPITVCARPLRPVSVAFAQIQQEGLVKL